MALTEKDTMRVAIRSYLAASHLLQNEPGLWDAIVILDSDVQETDFLDRQCRRHLILRFDDIVTQQSQKLVATEEDIAAAIAFAANASNLVVSCRAGQSRSAALAFVIAYKKLGPKAASQLWNPRRHSPNSLVLELASPLIDDPGFLQTYDHWRASNKGVSLVDYLDEIEAEIDQLEAAGVRNQITVR